MRTGKLLAVLSVISLTAVAPGDQTIHVVVVNEANAAVSMTRAEVAEAFLKKIIKWDDGLEVLPVDQASSSPVRESFTQSVYGRSVFAIKAYWQKMIFSGKATPPPELVSDSAILEYVREHEGAIGYVSTGAPVGDGVKTLRVTDP